VPVVSVFNRVKNKELTGASGQESVVLAAEVEKLGHCLHHGMNFPGLPFLYQASRSRGLFLHSNNKPLQ